VRDPLGGINTLWPLFGIANQLLAAVALSVATTILIKMHRARYAWITGIPLAWLVVVTFTAGWQKIFSPLPHVGFLAHAARMAGSGAADARRLVFNDRLDAVVCGVFLLLVATILLDSARVWAGILRGVRPEKLNEAPFVATALGPEGV
jgi:carbon starvation protein